MGNRGGVDFLIRSVALSPNLIEAANRAEATALLIRQGYRVYRPEADVSGEDLFLRQPAGGLIAVQLKGRLTVDWPRYGDSSIWMLFPDAPWDTKKIRVWFLVPHDPLFYFLEKQHGHTESFAKKVWSAAKPTRVAREFLAEFEVS